MYKLKQVANRPNTDYHYYDCDSLLDRDSIDIKNETIGCHAHIIDTDEDYILDSQKRWNKITTLRTGTKNYLELNHKPSINGIELKNDLTFKDLKIEDEIQIGGRNLAIGQSLDYKSFSGPFKQENTTVLIGVVSTQNLSSEDSITISFDLKIENIIEYPEQNSSLYVQGEGDVTGWGAGSFPAMGKSPLKNGLHRIKYTRKITNEHIKNNYWTVFFRFDNVKNGTFSWRDFKVEKGTVATDWSPAVEDIEKIAEELSVATEQTKEIADSAVKELKTLKPIAKSASFADLINVPNIIIGDKKYTIKVSNSIPTADDKSIITIVI